MTYAIDRQGNSEHGKKKGLFEYEFIIIPPKL